MIIIQQVVAHYGFIDQVCNYRRKYVLSMLLLTNVIRYFLCSIFKQKYICRTVYFNWTYEREVVWRNYKLIPYLINFQKFMIEKMFEKCIETITYTSLRSDCY